MLLNLSLVLRNPRQESDVNSHFTQPSRMVLRKFPDLSGSHCSHL